MNELSIVFEGAAGQGIQTIASTLLPILKEGGYHIFCCTEYMSRVRGGSNTAEIRITEIKRSAYRRRIDLLFALSGSSIDRLRGRIDSSTLLFRDPALSGVPAGGCRLVETPLKQLAAESGGAIFSGTVAAGIVLGLLDLPTERFEACLGRIFGGKGADVIARNIKAAALGHGFGAGISSGLGLDLPRPAGAPEPGELLMDGTTALGIGAIAAGCNFISSYPMSPSTGLLTFLASKSKAFGIVVDQAEDEIAAVNAGIGASYAGARALVTTSGGGFDLMQEGVSLAGMIETPLVIHLGQRPGPATGLPTRTEQGDLSLVVNAGHGSFARAVLAPGSLAELIDALPTAFDLALRFQIPVFVLTDQFILDAVSTVSDASIRLRPADLCLVETAAGYRRFEITEGGISPRGVPGFGTGNVRVDSDEHDEDGLITESFDMRRRMVEKRLRRMQELREAAFLPSRYGDAGAQTILISWGSNRGVMEEAIDAASIAGLSGMHFFQPYPLNPAVRGMLAGKRIAVLENNASGQFADLLAAEAGAMVSKRITKATGEPFAVEEIVDTIREAFHG